MTAPSGFISELAAARREKGLSLAEVACRAGVGESTVSHWETGRATPYGESLTAWAAALGFEVGLYEPAPPPDLSPETAELLQELIHTLAQLFKKDDE